MGLAVIGDLVPMPVWRPAVEKPIGEIRLVVVWSLELAAVLRYNEEIGERRFGEAGKYDPAALGLRSGA